MHSRYWHLLVNIILISHVFSLVVRRPDYTNKHRFEGRYKEIIDNKISDSPVITVFSFHALADHHLDNNMTTFETDKVQKGDIIYLCHDFIQWFAKDVHPHIKNPYILFTGDTGDYIPQKFAANMLFDPKLAAWFSRSTIFTNHKKLIQVPMGPTDQFFASFWEGGKETLLREMASKREKKHLVFMNYCARQWGDRDKIAKLMLKKELCFTKMSLCKASEFNGIKTGHMNFTEYCQAMKESKFVVSPLGLEVDCVRNWEALLLGCIPLIPRTYVDPMYYDLPVLFIDSWEALSKSYLEKKYKEIHNKKWNLEKIHFPYWERKVRAVQREVREQGMQYANLSHFLFGDEELGEVKRIFLQSRSKKTLMVGFLTGPRSFQVNKSLGGKHKLYLSDPYNDQMTSRFLERHMPSKRWLRFRSTIYKDSLAAFSGNYFLDLTHFRSRLTFHPKHWISQLDAEIKEIIGRSTKGTVIFGTQVNDPYVQFVLSKIEKETGLSVSRNGHTWKIVV